MTSIQNTHFNDCPHFRVSTRPNAGTPLPAADHQRLQHHLEQCEQSKDPGWRLLAYVLRDKIMKTDPAPNFHASDLVIGGSCVIFSEDRGPAQTGLLSHRARSAAGISVIPVASLLGATLIGMSVGQRAPLLFENGSIKSVSVLDVAPPV